MPAGVETRPVEYPLREKIYWHPPDAGGKGKWVDDPGGIDTAIVREIRACPTCAERARDAVEHPPPAMIAA